MARRAIAATAVPAVRPDEGHRRESRQLAVDGPYDFAGTLGPLAYGRRDPTTRVDTTEMWRAFRTPDGPGTLHLRRTAGGVEAGAYGPGAGWLLDHADAVAGLRDDPGDFPAVAARHPVVARLAKVRAGLRLPRTGRVFTELVPTILAQKVTSVEAIRSWTALARHFGEPAPGPVELLLPPDPAKVAATPYWAFHPFGVEQKRADTLRRVAAVAGRLEETVDMPREEATRRLVAVRGIGPWTVGEVGRTAYGDPDAVSVGDYHLPHVVSWLLAGEPRGDDDRMLELLAPFAGHRGRVMRLLMTSGIRAPARGPRRPIRSFARF